MDKEKILIDKKTLKKRIKELAGEITEDYKGKEPVLICVLKGAVFFFTDLARNIDLDCELDFMKAASYENEESTGEVDIQIDVTTDIKGRDVIVVEDIMDTGRTLGALLDHLKEKEPNSIKLCVLLDKTERRVIEDIKPDYTAFVVPNRFVIGYGLDYNQKYRNRPTVNCIVKDDDKDLEKDREGIKKQLVKTKKRK
jgi:hypoxanthine phosphoribosyltransferase